jgi:outer membrane protein TolC
MMTTTTTTMTKLISTGVGRGPTSRIWSCLLAAALILPGAQAEGQERGPRASGHATAGDTDAAVQEGRRVTLQQAVALAIEHNPQLEAARYALEEADEQVSEAWGNVFPTLDLSTTFTRNLTPALNFLPAVLFDPTADPNDLIPVRFGADNLWSLSLNLEQPIFNAAAFIGVGAAGRFKALQDEAVRGQVQEVVTRVRTAYYQLLLSQEQVRLVENSLARVRATLAETRALNEAGLVSDYDVLRLEVEEANLVPNLRRSRNAVLQARRTLAVELDLEDGAGETLQVAGSLAEMDLASPENNSADNQAILALAGVDRDWTRESLVDEALAGRSDIRQLEAQESLRRTELQLARTEYLPKLSLFGTYSINSQQNGSPDFFGGPRAFNRLAGVQLTLPIFQGFQRDARIDQRSAVVRQVQAQTAYARSQAASQVRSLFEQVEESQLRAEGQQLAVAQARRGFEIARAEYAEGLGSQLQVTDAEVALRQSEFNYAQAVYDYLAARARLDEAVGRVPTGDEGR